MGLGLPRAMTPAAGTAGGPGASGAAATALLTGVIGWDFVHAPDRAGFGGTAMLVPETLPLTDDTPPRPHEKLGFGLHDLDLDTAETTEGLFEGDRVSFCLAVERNGGARGATSLRLLCAPLPCWRRWLATSRALSNCFHVRVKHSLRRSGVRSFDRTGMS